MSLQHEQRAKTHQLLKMDHQSGCSAICDLNNTFQHCIKMNNQNNEYTGKRQTIKKPPKPSPSDHKNAARSKQARTLKTSNSKQSIHGITDSK
jgi:hypothetical protein